jgi:hypothetical protein
MTGVETRFTDRIESAIREERRQAALRQPAANDEAGPDVADQDGVHTGEIGSPQSPSGGASPARRSADQQTANDAVSTGTV